jgi:hypothetical protein
VKAPTVFETGATNHISAVPLADGKALIAYTDEGNSYYGTFVVYDAVGGVVKSPTVFKNANTIQIAAGTFKDGQTLLAYRDVDNSDYGTLAVYRGSGVRFAQDAVIEGNLSVGTTASAARLTVYRDSPTADEYLMQVGTSDSDIRFTVDEDGDVRAEGSLTAGKTGAAHLLTGTSFGMTDGSSPGYLSFRVKRQAVRRLPTDMDI